MWSPTGMRRLSRFMRSSIERHPRLVRFEKEIETSVPQFQLPSLRRLSRDYEDGAVDYDSCVSPTVNASSGETSPGDRFGSSLSINMMREHSHSDADLGYGDDFDSCLSPVSSPKWSMRDLETYMESNKSPSLRELHKLLVGGYITHFSATRDFSHHGMTLEVCPKVKPRTVIISGSFNPLHHGHEALARRAIGEEGENACGDYFFEMSTINVDKGPLSYEEMEKRVQYIIQRGHRCMLTNAILFDAKAELFPNCIFAIGFDTYIRVVNPKYYPRVTGGIDATMARIEAHGCEFFVGGRITQGEYRSLAPSPRNSLRRSSAVVTPTTGRSITPSSAGESLVILMSSDDGNATEDQTDFQMVELPPASEYRGKAFCLKTSNNEFGQICKEEPISPIFTGIPLFRHDISSTEIREIMHRSTVDE